MPATPQPVAPLGPLPEPVELRGEALVRSERWSQAPGVLYHWIGLLGKSSPESHEFLPSNNIGLSWKNFPMIQFYDYRNTLMGENQTLENLVRSCKI